MATCPYDEGGDETYARCRKFRDATGFVCSVWRDKDCGAHMAAGGPDVPLEDVPGFTANITRRIAGRLRHGDCPMYQVPNPIDILDAAARLTVLLSEAQTKALLRDIADSWSELSITVGGHPPEVVEEKLRQVARAWNAESELDKWAERIAR